MKLFTISCKMLSFSSSPTLKRVSETEWLFQDPTGWFHLFWLLPSSPCATVRKHQGKPQAFFNSSCCEPFLHLQLSTIFDDDVIVSQKQKQKKNLHAHVLAENLFWCATWVDSLTPTSTISRCTLLLSGCRVAASGLLVMSSLGPSGAAEVSRGGW